MTDKQKQASHFPPLRTTSSLCSVSLPTSRGTPLNSFALNERFPFCRVSSPTVSRDPSFPPPECQTHAHTHAHSFRPFVGQIAHYMQVEKPQQLKPDSLVSSSQSFLGSRKEGCMFLIPMFCYLGVEMSVCSVCDRVQQTFSVSRGPVNDLNDHRFDNEVLLCCLH